MCSALTFMKGGGALLPPRSHPVPMPGHDTDIRSGVLPSWEPTEQPDASNALPQLGSQEGIMCRLQRKCGLFCL